MMGVSTQLNLYLEGTFKTDEKQIGRRTQVNREEDVIINLE